MARKPKIRSTWSLEFVAEWVAVGGGAILLAATVYVLSVGPALRIVQSNHSDKRVVIEVYKPVLLLVATPLKPWLKWYLELWGVR